MLSVAGLLGKSIYIREFPQVLSDVSIYSYSHCSIEFIAAFSFLYDRIGSMCSLCERSAGWDVIVIPVSAINCLQYLSRKRLREGAAEIVFLHVYVPFHRLAWQGFFSPALLSLVIPRLAVMP